MLVPGTAILCLKAPLIAGPAVGAVCNIVRLPGNAACIGNGLYCYKQNCGLINLDRLPFSLIRDKFKALQGAG